METNGFQRVVLICFTILTILNRLVLGQNWLINSLLPDDYDRDQIPTQVDVNNGILQVNSSITMNFFHTHERESSLVIDMFLCLEWHDYRLKSLTADTINIPDKYANDTDRRLHYTKIRLSSFSKLWIPQVMFRNAISSSPINSVQRIRYAEIWPDTKLVNYCQRLSVTFLCQFNLANFPFDEHYCHLELESVQNANKNRIKLEMVRINMPVNNIQFRVRNRYLLECDPHPADIFQFERTIPLNNTCTMASVRLIRRCAYYILRYYCNSFLMVCISFITFWIPTHGWPSRVICSNGVLLTLIHVSLGAYNESPAAYMTAMYWWLWGCQFFIYMTFVSFATALAWVQFVNDKKYAHETNTESPDGHFFGKNGRYKRIGIFIEKCLNKVFGPIDHFNDPQGRNKMDYISRVMFPFMWLVFTITYIIATLSVWGQKYRW